MDPKFKRNLVIITALHVVLILVLAVHAALSDWLKRRKVEPVTFMEIQSVVEQTVAPPEAVQDVQEPPEPEAVREPDPPPPEPEVQVEPEPREVEPPRRKEIEVSKKLVRRPSDPPPQRTPSVRPQDLQQALADALPTPTRATTTEFPFPLYLERVKRALYEAWRQPGGGTVPPGTVSRVTITVDRSGRVTRHTLIGPSGDARMDASVLEAVRAVPRLEPLPDGYGGSSRDITIDFELIGGGL